MQLARNVFPEQLPASQRTLARKLLEVRVAQEIERAFSKDEILEMYLNHIYFGHGARGIEAAARHYFGVPAARADVAQAALLAALPKAPTHYDPRRRPERAKERRDLVITLMEQQGRLTPARPRPGRAHEAASGRRPPKGAAGRARRSPAGSWRRSAASSRRRSAPTSTTRSCASTRRWTPRRSGPRRRSWPPARGGGEGRPRPLLGPRTTTRSPADEDVTPYLQGAVVCSTSERRRAGLGRRPRLPPLALRPRARRAPAAGSAFKPFVYAAALNAGPHDEPDPLGRAAAGAARPAPVWQPQNFDGAFEGRVTLREALVRSRNVPTVRLATDVGYDAVARLAEDAG